MRILFTCGGTGGHINPAISVAKLFKIKRPESVILFVGGANGMETKLVPDEGFALKTIDVRSLKRGVSPAAFYKNAAMLFKMAGLLSDAKRIVEAFSPDVVVGTGGYASFPVVYAASRLGIPTVIHESNAVPGLTTRLLSRRADRILVSFEESVKHYKRPQAVRVTGTPVREAFIYTQKQPARQALRLDERPLVVSYWGSLGAREMNKITAEFMRLEEKSKAFYHIHATGSYGYRWMPGLVRDLGVELEQNPQLQLREYIYDMPQVMAAADLVICRAGASTLSELAAAGKPAIIIPSPNVAGNHQEKNARVLGARGAANVLLEKDCNAKDLYTQVCTLLEQPEKLALMSEKMSSLAVMDAAERIYESILDAVNEKK